ncbi:glutamate--cysteine ligase [Corynebacterium cystitidis]|uniref:glutamate--cysteine ligase n=1 Tax=Corynebacterium cystitidis TaxID=35757 RepID=UPI00211E0B0A|nr:glutamate--cysteine ligase [Corynebacterium cystitidis]
MGDAVSSDTYSPRQRTKYRKRLLDDLEVFDSHLQAAEFIDQGTIGLELELNLVDKHMQPTPRNQEVLAELDHEYQSEIGSYNVELNHPPLSLEGEGLRRLHEGLDERLSTVREAAAKADATVAMIGTLPTMTTEFLEDPAWMTKENRYQALNNAIVASRGELMRIDISGAEDYFHEFDDIAPESTCTSMQLHLQVAPSRFANVWNASQAIAGVQVALGANSPLFSGRRLWHESRIPVFEQSIDTRTPELVLQGVRPRVWFGERWITSVFDLFEENVRYYSPILPEGRSAPIMDGDSPALHYLNLHNGTVWRWNRPIYDSSLDHSHIRVENRLLPAGPTVADIIADAAFYYGLVKFQAEQNRPVWSRLTFDDARNNFFSAARNSLYSRQVWPTLGRISAAELVTKHLLPQAREGLAALGVSPELIDEYLGIIHGRATTRQNGAAWQLVAAKAFGRGSAPDSEERRIALAQMLELYLDNQATGKPVHYWEVPTS